MTPEYEPSNATLLAELRGLDTFMRESVKRLDEKVEPMAGIPIKVATLESDMKTVKDDVEEIKRERSGVKNRAIQWISVGVAVLIGFATITLYILQTIRLGG